MNIIYDILDWYHSGRLGGQKRSANWRTIRNEHIENHPTCECCGKKNKIIQPLEVHHKKPFYLNPELELEPTNLITLCRSCHLLVGHLMNYKNYNDKVDSDSLYFNQRITNNS